MLTIIKKWHNKKYILGFYRTGIRNFVLTTKASLRTKSVAKMRRRIRIGQAENKRTIKK